MGNVYFDKDGGQEGNVIARSGGLGSWIACGIILLAMGCIVLALELSSVLNSGKDSSWYIFMGIFCFATGIVCLAMYYHYRKRPKQLITADDDRLRIYDGKMKDYVTVPVREVDDVEVRIYHAHNFQIYNRLGKLSIHLRGQQTIVISYVEDADEAKSAIFRLQREAAERDSSPE